MLKAICLLFILNFGAAQEEEYQPQNQVVVADDFLDDEQLAEMEFQHAYYMPFQNRDIARRTSYALIFLAWLGLTFHLGQIA